MKLKSDVILHDTLMWGAIIVEECLAITAPEVACVITAGIDGQHMKDSLHYTGKALDFRTRDLFSGQQQIWVALCEEKLGPCWDVVLEKDHLHVEYDPK